MVGKAKGKPLKYRPLRLDDDVWAELQKMKAHGTINEGLREALGLNGLAGLTKNAGTLQDVGPAPTPDPKPIESKSVARRLEAQKPEKKAVRSGESFVDRWTKVIMETPLRQRPLMREKGDKSR